MRTVVAPSTWQSAGKQEFRIEGDTLFLRLRELVEESELRVLSESGKALAALTGYYIVICDTSRSTGLSAAARRYNAAFNKDNRDILAVSIIYGANLVLRQLATLITRGMALLSTTQLQLIFVKDEAEALAVAQTERTRLRAAAARRVG